MHVSGGLARDVPRLTSSSPIVREPGRSLKYLESTGKHREKRRAGASDHDAHEVAVANLQPANAQDRTR